jgi:PIN domain nuclease of toxin-antitoxin system
MANGRHGKQRPTLDGQQGTPGGDAWHYSYDPKPNIFRTLSAAPGTLNTMGKMVVSPVHSDRSTLFFGSGFCSSSLNASNTWPASTFPDNRASRSGGIGISAITLWELAWLATHGRLEIDGTVEAYVDEVSSRVAVRPLTAKIAVLANQLPQDYSSDPCDRLIGATALAEGIALVTKDAKIRSSKQLRRSGSHRPSSTRTFSYTCQLGLGTGVSDHPVRSGSSYPTFLRLDIYFLSALIFFGLTAQVIPLRSDLRVFCFIGSALNNTGFPPTKQTLASDCTPPRSLSCPQSKRGRKKR